jgi:hypothetical protein
MDTLWYSGDDIPASNELIFEEHIPFFLEEEVVAECVESEVVVSPSTNGRSQESSSFGSKISDSKHKPTLTINRDSMKVHHRDIQTQNQKSGSLTPSSANFKPFVLNEYTMKVGSGEFYS